MIEKNNGLVVNLDENTDLLIYQPISEYSNSLLYAKYNSIRVITIGEFKKALLNN